MTPRRRSPHRVLRDRRVSTWLAAAAVLAAGTLVFLLLAQAPGAATSMVLLDATVGTAFGLSALVSPGPVSSRLLLASVGAAWWVESVVTLGSPHQGALLFALAVFPRPRRDLVTGIAAGAAVPLALGVLTQGVAATAFLVVAVARLLVRRGAPVATLYAVLSSAAVGLVLLSAAVAQAWWPDAFEPRTLLVVYEVLLVVIAGAHVAAASSIAPGLTRRMRPVLDRHRTGAVPAGEALQTLVRRAVGDPALRLVLPDLDGPAAGQEVPGWQTVTREDGRAVALVRFTRTDGPASTLEDALSAVRLVATTVSLRAEQERELRELEAARVRLLRAVDRQRADVLARLRPEVLGHLDRAGTVLASALDRAGAPSDELTVARDEVGRAVRDIEALVRGEPPRPLGHGALLEALRALTAGTPSTSWELPGELSASPEVETALYYVCAEAIANAGKHAGARQVRVVLRAGTDEISVRVQDDGVGGADPGGSGLRGLAERLHVLDGSLVVRTGPGGTSVEATVPTRSGSTARR